MATALQVLAGEGMWINLVCQDIVVTAVLRGQRCPQFVPEVAAVGTITIPAELWNSEVGDFAMTIQTNPRDIRIWLPG